MVSLARQLSRLERQRYTKRLWVRFQSGRVCIWEAVDQCLSLKSINIASGEDFFKRLLCLQ